MKKIPNTCLCKRNKQLVWLIKESYYPKITKETSKCDLPLWPEQFPCCLSELLVIEIVTAPTFPEKHSSKCEERAHVFQKTHLQERQGPCSRSDLDKHVTHAANVTIELEGVLLYFNWQLGAGESHLKRESHLREFIDLVSLWFCLRVSCLLTDVYKANPL